MSQWQRARPEIILVAILAVIASGAALAVAGWPGLAVVATASAAIALLEIRGLAPRPAEATARKARETDASGTRSVTGYSQRRFLVTSGISAMEFYEGNLRPELEHLLAARLAERHGLNLYTDPAAAKRVFVRSLADEALWQWIDPAAAVGGKGRGLEGRGIPRRALARLIDRLEHL
jgi:hypothetical protein